MPKLKIRKALKTLSKMCDGTYCTDCPFSISYEGIIKVDECGFKKMQPVGYHVLAEDNRIKKFEEDINNARFGQS